MSAPSVSQTILDNGLGLSGPSSAGVHVKVGVTSLGTAATLYKFSDPKTLKDTLGTGPAVEAAAHALRVQNGGVVYVMKTANSTAGSQGSWTLTGSGLDPGVTSSGTPKDNYQVIVLITRSGAVGTAAFKVSFDGGDTYSAEYSSAASVATFAAETGLTLLFATGSYVAGDTYTSTSSAPAFTTSDLNTALDALHANPASWEFCHIVGSASTLAGFNTLFAAVSTKIGVMVAAYRYVFAIVELPDMTDAAMAAESSGTPWTAYQALVDPNISVCAGYAEITSAITGRIHRRSAAWPYAARLASIAIQRDPGAVADGTLPDVVSLARDERTATTSFHDLATTTLKTFTAQADAGVPGYFITGGRIKVAPTSDFRDVPNRRVMNRAATIAYAAMLQVLNGDFETTGASEAVDEHPTGSITEEEAQRIEGPVNAKLRSLISSKSAVTASVRINRTNDVAGTDQVLYDVRVRPRGYARTIVGTVAFTRN